MKVQCVCDEIMALWIDFKSIGNSMIADRYVALYLHTRGHSIKASHYYRIITRAVKAVAIIIGVVIGIVLWAIARPILRE